MECIRIHIYCFGVEYRCSRKKVAKFAKKDLSGQMKCKTALVDFAECKDRFSVIFPALVLNIFVPKKELMKFCH